MEKEIVQAENEGSASKILSPKEIGQNIVAATKWLKKGNYSTDDARWKQWEKNKKYLMCVWPDSKPNDVNVNTIRGNHNTIRPTLYFKNPKVSAVPTKPNFTRDEYGNVVKKNGAPILLDNYTAAKIASVKINYELKEIKFKKLMRKVVSDADCPYGVGWAKVGYSTYSVGGHDNDRDTRYSYWIQRVDPRLIRYDWRATDIDNAQYVVEQIILTRQDAEDYGFDIPEGYVAKLPDFLESRAKTAKKDSGNDLVVIDEYYDLKNRMLYWVIVYGDDGAGTKFAKDPVPDPYPFEGSCYVPLVLDEDNDDIIGLSSVESVEDQALAINRIRTKQTKHVEWFGTRTDYEDGAIEPSEIDKVKVTDHGVFLKVNVGGLGKVQTQAPVSMGQDNYAMVNEHKDDMRTTLGITEFQQGSVGQASTKATTANIVQNSAIARIEEKRDIIHDFVVDCVRKLFACIQMFSSDEEYLNLKDEVLDEDFVGVLKKDYGYDPKIPFLRMSRADIQGEFNFEFNVEDMIVQPKEIRAQQFTNFLNVVFTNPLITQKFVEDYDLSKVLKKGADLFGIDLGEVKKGGPAQIPAERENLMFGAGMEVPEPHAKDDDDEHIVSHGRFIREKESETQKIKAQAQAISAKIQEMQAQISQVQAQVIDPAMASKIPQVPSELQQQLDELISQMEPIQNMIRKAKIHSQFHDMNRKKKETSGMGGGAGQMPQGQPAASMQAQMQGQAGSIQ